MYKGQVKTIALFGYEITLRKTAIKMMRSFYKTTDKDCLWQMRLSTGNHVLSVVEAVDHCQSCHIKSVPLTAWDGGHVCNECIERSEDRMSR